MRIGLVRVLLGWAAASLAGVPPLDRVIESEWAPWLLVLLPFGIAAYAFAGWRYLRLYRVRRRPLPLAVAVAFVLLAEALVAMAFGHAWQASWWEWHVLMAVAFATIVLASRREYRRSRSMTGAFGGIYLDRTLERLDADPSRPPGWQGARGLRALRGPRRLHDLRRRTAGDRGHPDAERLLGCGGPFRAGTGRRAHRAVRRRRDPRRRQRTGRSS